MSNRTMCKMVNGTQVLGSALGYLINTFAGTRGQTEYPSMERCVSAPIKAIWIGLLLLMISLPTSALAAEQPYGPIAMNTSSMGYGASVAPHVPTPQVLTPQFQGASQGSLVPTTEVSIAISRPLHQPHALTQGLVNHKTLAMFSINQDSPLTILSPAMAEKLDAKASQSNQKAIMHTPQGPVEVPVVTIQTLSIGAMELHDIQAIVLSLDDSNSHIGGMLGKNCFVGMDMRIQGNRMVLTFKP